MRKTDNDNKILMSGKVQSVIEKPDKVILQVNGTRVVFSGSRAKGLVRLKLQKDETIILIGILRNADVIGWGLHRIGTVNTVDHMLIRGKITKREGRKIYVQVSKRHYVLEYPFSINLHGLKMERGKTYTLLCFREYISECPKQKCILRSPISCKGCTSVNTRVTGMTVMDYEK